MLPQQRRGQPHRAIAQSVHGHRIAHLAHVLGELVSVAFSQRRKLLRHTLGRWLDARGYAAAFDLQRRAEEVPVAQYVALAEQVQRSAPVPPQPPSAARR